MDIPGNPHNRRETGASVFLFGCERIVGKVEGSTPEDAFHGIPLLIVGRLFINFRKTGRKFETKFYPCENVESGKLELVFHITALSRLGGKQMFIVLEFQPDSTERFSHARGYGFFNRKKGRALDALPLAVWLQRGQRPVLGYFFSCP